MKKLTIVLLMITMLLLSNVTFALTEENQDLSLYSELSFNQYIRTGNDESDLLKLNIVDNHKVTIEFNFHIQADEMSYYTDATYYYNMVDDILIIYTVDGEIIYDDLNL